MLRPSTASRFSTHAPAGGATSPGQAPCKGAAISTHAPAGGATRDCKDHRRPHAFLLTPLREGRPTTSARRTFIPYFYSRPCGRGDGNRLSLASPCGLFLLTPLREGRLGIFTLCLLVQQFLLTPLREGRRGLCAKRPLAFAISTHAPAGGATNSIAQQRNATQYFYSRPCGRGDFHDQTFELASSNFYSRPCGRGDCNFPQVRHEVLRQIAER